MHKERHDRARSDQDKDQGRIGLWWMCPHGHIHLQGRDEEGRTYSDQPVSSLDQAVPDQIKRKADRYSLCPHFKMSRQDLFHAIKIKQLKKKDDIFREISTMPDSQGCEICKPAIGSILSSLYNEHVMTPRHHHNQDTNDRFLGNIQRNGTFSVVPRIPGGEVTPERLVAIGQVASEYGLYTKITGGQRIDMFGAQKQDLPAIWSKLHEAGLESGELYCHISGHFGG